VICFSGLGNRLRVLLSALTVAEATGRRLMFYWPRTADCGAALGELFEINLDPIEGEPPAIKTWPSFGGWTDPPTPDLLRATQPHLVLSTTDWLVQPTLYPAHVPLLARCAELLEALRPVAYVREQVQALQAAHFRPQMIGLHLRRGDFRRAQPGSAANTTAALAAAAGFLEQMPRAGLMLCSDDGALDPWTGQPWSAGVRAEFSRAFGQRLVQSQPRTLDRQRPEAIQDALVDLLLLRQTDAVVGTAHSTFSEMAVFGRAVPRVLCRAAPAPAAARVERLFGALWLDQLYRRVVMRRYGKLVPVRILFWHLSAAPRLWLRAVLQRYSPGFYRWVRARRGLPARKSV
jgi:hypothetical protein